VKTVSRASCRKLLLASLLWLGPGAGPAVATNDPGATDRAAEAAGPDGRGIIGEWLTEGAKGRVAIYPASGASGVYEGRIVSGRDGPDAPRDVRNPDPALRQRPVKGIVFMTGFRYVGEGRYEEGRIYDPGSGNTYRGRLRLLSPELLQLRGFLGISLFGATQTWRRVSPAEAASETGQESSRGLSAHQALSAG
jgi:uncharacterized protein (DUF2147 family)